MRQKTRRATEAVEAHLDYLEGCHPGSVKDLIEGTILDPCRDPGDPRFGHEEFLYDGKTFQHWLGEIAGSAKTFTATTDLMREVALTTEMLDEEGIDFVSLRPETVPIKQGFFLFPYGVENPAHHDYGVTQRAVRRADGRRGEYLLDMGGGTRHMVDGFFWSVSDRVSRDGHAGEPTEGIIFFLLTRHRNDDDRPFRQFRTLHPDLPTPALVASDMSAWAYDLPEATGWIDPEFLTTEGHNITLATGTVSREDLQEELEYNRLWVRRLIWSCFRWLTEEIWNPEDAETRQLSRRFKRARPVLHENLPEDGDIVVVDLRKYRDAVQERSESGEPPWWRTRWQVEGHWARRRIAIRDEQGNSVGPVRGPGSVYGETYLYRQVYIEPFEKGPSDRPLVIKDKVGVLSR